ncbi:MAG: hypothetical protein IJ880_17230 [Bacilli bacterium]|nr:hypothetical protein [Bacilli bacterium]
MILNVAFNDSHEQIIKKLRELLKEYPLVELRELNEESFLTRKDALKLKYHYGAQKSPFANLTDNDKVHVEAFYSENKSFNLDYIKAVLDHWILYNPREDGLSGNKEEA